MKNLITIRAGLVPSKTRLKCKPCHKFYEDDNTVATCEECGRDLKRITVYSLMPKDLIINPTTEMVEDDKHKEG